MNDDSRTPGTDDGRGEALGDAVARHARWLRLTVRARLGPGRGQEIDEVMQAIALAAVSRPSALPPPDKVPAFLYRLAVRQVLLHRRQAGRRRRMMDRYASRVEAADADRDPLDWLLSAERSQRIRRVLDRLPPRDAEILLLKYTESWTARELADHLGVSPGAVDARLHRVRERLRHELARDGLIVGDRKEAAP